MANAYHSSHTREVGIVNYINTLAKCNEDAYLPSLHLSTVELRCKLQEKLHRVTWPQTLNSHYF